MTRPDLAWSYSELSKYVQFPGIAHMEVAEHVLQYLRDTWNESITYTCGSRNPNELWDWVDTDWAGGTDTRRSHTGYILMMNGEPISWKISRQDNVSLSTSEAKFVAASQAGQEALYLRETLKDLGYQQHNATEIYEDNLACVAMSENPVGQKISRHTLTSATIACANSSRLVLSNAFLCAHMKWSPMHLPSLCLHPHSPATAAL